MYDKNWLQVERPQPMYDSSINDFYSEIWINSPVHIEDLDQRFKSEFTKFIQAHSSSRILGLDSFEHVDICVGCTQYIDDIYQRVGYGNVQIVANDYRYHWRLNPDLMAADISALSPGKDLIISMPFPAIGDVHPRMQEMLDHCATKRIPVHVDAAWLTCCKDIDFNFSHPAISSVGISLSKAGLGNNRIACRFSRVRPHGAISIMNDFHMNNQSLMHIGLKFMQDIGPEYFWRRYARAYEQVCSDFNLIATKAVHIAKTVDGHPVGIRPLLRCLGPN
jgi:hypothetical protein